MARYNLIMRNTTYIALTQEAVKRKISFGKLVNKILDDAVREFSSANTQEQSNPVCAFCGKPASYEGTGFGQQKLYVCSFHESYLRTNLRQYSRLLNVDDDTHPKIRL